VRDGAGKNQQHIFYCACDGVLEGIDYNPLQISISRKTIVSDQDTRILWQPSDERVRQTNLSAFIEATEDDWPEYNDGNIGDFEGLYEFSIEEKERFWQSLIDFAGVSAETWGKVVLENPDKMPGAVWFPDAKLNYTENLLRSRDDTDALVFWGEDQVKTRFSHKELYDEVSRLAQAMRAAGLQEGDRVGAYMPNMPETIIAMLAVVSIGGIWSSCSPDFGVRGVLDRFGQIEPKMVIVCDGYFYNGKSHDSLEKATEILAQLPSVKITIVVPYSRQIPPIKNVPHAVMWDDFTKDYNAQDIEFNRVSFNHPLYIMYSSGTTGAPKCIVHGAGGTLLKHLSEHLLHSDEKPGDRVFYFTTCGWMMWNWLVSGLACGATLLLYDGSPFYPDGNVIFDFAEAEGMTHFGTSAKYIDAVKKAGLEPAKTHDLSKLKSMMSTGSPLVPESFDFVYEKIKSDLHLASISGGTDIVGCFVLGNPVAPVWRGEIQTRALGMAVDVFDHDGNSLREEAGDLVCTKPFPSMPVGFWADENGAKYKAAYFEDYPNVWCHGDWVELTARGGMVIYGRSDATLNPGGVRIGTAEIYRQVEQFDEVIEGLCIGQIWDNDTRVVLFIVMRDGYELTEGLQDAIRKRIRENCTQRHVPAKIIAVPDIPRTKSGKITELAVRDIIEGRPIKNAEALANADALEFFKDLPELQV
jgi:acetoacetyl-CoA synthetase